MRKKTNKSPKLRELTCSLCGKNYYDYISPSEIANRKTFSCSMKCKSIINSRHSLKGVWSKCIVCGKSVRRSPSIIKKGRGKYCSKVCAGTNKQGKAISLDGYYVLSGKKVHRTIMEAHIGRKLLPTEIVHHLNFDKLDNRIGNLQIVTRAEHNKIHFSKSSC